MYADEEANEGVESNSDEKECSDILVSPIRLLCASQRTRFRFSHSAPCPRPSCPSRALYPVRKLATKGYRAFPRTGPVRCPRTGMGHSTAFDIELHTQVRGRLPNPWVGRARHCVRNSGPLERSNSSGSVRG